MATDTKHNYQHTEPVLMAVDCIIFGVDDNRLKLLIFKREIEPLAGQWSLLGSFIRANESVSEAASRILFELTGIDDVYMEQLHCFGDVNRDPGARVVSVGYWSLIKANQDDSGFQIDGHEAKWIYLDEIPQLILDHNDMVSKAVLTLRERARFRPIGFELVPKEFTIAQLLKVYEAIFARPLDDRNFRKKLINSGLLTQLDKKDKSTSKKGSYLYAFNEKRYEQLSAEGYHFGF